MSALFDCGGVALDWYGKVLEGKRSIVLFVRQTAFPRTHLLEIIRRLVAVSSMGLSPWAGSLPTTLIA